MEPLWNECGGNSENARKKITHEPIIPLLNIYLNVKTQIQRDIRIPIKELVTIAKSWRQLKCPSLGQLNKKNYFHSLTHKHTQTGILLRYKKVKFLLFSITWMKRGGYYAT